MGNYSSRRLIGDSLLVAGLALAFVGAPALWALAQDKGVGHAGALVEVTAAGEDVRAAGATVTVTGEAKSIQVAGANISVRANATEDVQLAGAQVQYDGTVGGDLQVLGASVDLRGRVAGGLDAAGAVVVLNAVTGGNLRVAGASVTVGPGSDVAGSLQGGGANFVISGHVAGKVDVAGGLVTVNARTDGSVEVRAAQVIVNAPARISGDLIVYSLNEPVIAEGAVISGKVTRFAPPNWWSTGPKWIWIGGLALAIVAGTVLAGIVLMLFGGRVFATATEHVRHRPLSSFLFGIITFVLIPFVAVILMATLIGISVGFAILLVMPFLVIFGHAVAAAGIASGILVRRHGELGIALGLLMLIIGAIVLVALGLIPYAGPGIVAIALVLGTGAFTRTIGARIRRAEPRPVI